MKLAIVETIGTRVASPGLRGITGGRVARTKITGMLVVILLTAAYSSALTATTSTISSSLNPSTYGQAVTFTASVTSSLGAPPNGETITFLQGSTVLGTGKLSGGSADFTISTLTTGGTDNVKASYPGDSTFASSTSKPVGQVVNKAMTATSLASSQNPVNVGQPVTFTATVTATGITVTGNVLFTTGSKRLGNVTLSGGIASVTTTALSTGTDPVIATYNGDNSFLSSTSNTVNETVGSGSVYDSTMTWNNVTRYYEVYVPTSIPANPAMVLMLHGTQSQSTPNAQAIISLNWGWQNVANKYGFILVKPASTYNPTSHQWNWNAYNMSAAFTSSESGTCTAPPATACPDDAGFLRQLISTLTPQYNVNPNQVYVAGFSSGAQMAHRVAVEISDLVAAVVIGSGTIVGQSAPPPIILPGIPAAPVSIQEWHGTADTEIPPCNNGTTGYSGHKFYLATVDQSFNYWTQQNGCAQFANTLPLCAGGAANSNTTGNDATGCTNGAEVQFIWEEGTGHAWANGQDTARWQFFAAHPKPE